MQIDKVKLGGVAQKIMIKCCRFSRDQVVEHVQKTLVSVIELIDKARTRIGDHVN
ncbi:hypothetical protein Bealeia1_02039 (plasmid) [Candidatus Bealeia paramacronuclearis]|uniref:Uncharacterized protein n=1 Tax=Candidatus Bealeia paramacronuclearis TaxID=1921001 RepID=A0ABZ2C8K9_9PROT